MLVYARLLLICIENINNFSVNCPLFIHAISFNLKKINEVRNSPLEPYTSYPCILVSLTLHTKEQNNVYYL